MNHAAAWFFFALTGVTPQSTQKETDIDLFRVRCPELLPCCELLRLIDRRHTHGADLPVNRSRPFGADLQQPPAPGSQLVGGGWERSVTGRVEPH